MKPYTDKSSGWKVSMINSEGGPVELVVEDLEKKQYKRIVHPKEKFNVEKWIEYIIIANNSRNRTSDSIYQYAQRLLLMVHELHKLGFQMLRIYPGVAASGGYWRCTMAPAKYFYADNGIALAVEKIGGKFPFYSTGMGNKFFGWEDCLHDDSRELARKFMQRLPEVLIESEGRDWEYVGWYTEMLKYSERAIFPQAYDDLYNCADCNFVKTSSQNIVLPLPPGGKAVRKKY